MSPLKVIAIDPYHKTYGLLVPMLAQKMVQAAQSMGDDQGLAVPEFLGKLWRRDDDVLLLAAIDPNGYPKGFCMATYLNGDTFMLQPKQDEPATNDAVAEMIQAVKDWARSKGSKYVTLIARRGDPKWLKKHDFAIERYIAVAEV